MDEFYDEVVETGKSLGFNLDKDKFLISFIGGSKCKGTEDKYSDNDYHIIMLPDIYNLMFDKKPFNHAFKVDFNGKQDDVRVMTLESLYKIILKHDDYSYSLLFSLIKEDNEFVNTVFKEFKDYSKLLVFMESNQYRIYKTLLNACRSNLRTFLKEDDKSTGKLLVELFYEFNLLNKVVSKQFNNFTSFQYKELLSLKRLSLSELKDYDYSQFKCLNNEVQNYNDLELYFNKYLDEFDSYDKNIFEREKSSNKELSQTMIENLRLNLANYCEYKYKSLK